MLATNRPEDLDEAVVDRIDETLEFPLPGPEERGAILRQQLETQARGVKSGMFGRQPTQLAIDADVDKAITSAARATKGFSGRQLEKLIAAVRASALASSTPTINAKMIEEVVALKVAQAKGRESFRKTAA